MNWKIIQSHSIKIRVMLFTLVIFVISIWSLTFYTDRMLRSDVLRLLGEQQFSTATFVAAEVNNELKDRMDALELASRSYHMTAMGDTAAMQTFLRERPVLQHLFNGGVTVYRFDGIAIAEHPRRGRVGINYADREYTVAATREGRSTIGKPHVSVTQKFPEFIMAVPFRDAHGKVIGTLAGVTDLSMHNFLDKLTENTYGKTGGYLLVAPQDRQVITATDKSRVMEKLPAPGVNPAIDRFIQGYEGFDVFANPQGVEVLASAKGIPVTGWYVGVVLPTAEAYVPIHDMRQRTLLAAIILTLLPCILIWLILSRQGRAEEAIRASEQCFRGIFENAADVILLISLDGYIRDANPEACRVYGYAHDEFVGKHGSEFVHPEQIGKFGGALVAIQAGQNYSEESVDIRKDGTPFPIEVLISPFTHLGEPVMLCFIRDISERKKAEQALTESLLKLKEKELSKTRFFAAAGHDLRQPLAAANLFLDALKCTEPTPGQGKIIQSLDQAMSTFGSLLDSLLNISKLDSGAIKPEYAPVSVTETFNWLEQSFAPMASAKRIGFKLYFPMKETVVVLTDIGLLNSVLSNLASNAIKYTLKGAILISARKRGTDVLFQVWDTGIGIAGEHIEHIFDEFYQVENPQRDRAAGMGLGLAISKRAITLLGSKITCRSQVGRGSVFEFCLPLDGNPGEAKQQGDIVAAIQGELTDLSFVRGKRFVVVEDDLLVAQGLTQSLEGLGGVVECFHNAKDALHHINIGYADYFIVDYMLGGALNGIEFLHLLRQKLGKPINAVLITGDTSGAFIQETANFAWPVLHKPVNTFKLISCLGAQKEKHA